MKTKIPFIFGTQYYRAPTPEPECWKNDLKRIKELGFNSIKYFVQWRWSHRKENEFYFDDLDKLMDLAEKNGLDVTLNTLLDMSPLWLFKKYPNAKQIANDGSVIEPYAVGHRSIGGHPGPCYNHAGALAERKKFMIEVIKHFKQHPALSMWDVWNEPELSFQQRHPNINQLVCYCDYCRKGFIKWLKTKYHTIENLNNVWGRCYSCWDEVEMPRTTGCIIDFVDWREFHLDTLSAEAAWRLQMVEQLDHRHLRYLHVVPNTMRCFNSVTCVDDFAVADNCQVFAATVNGNVVQTTQLISAAKGKTCYNVESHINNGYLSLHQKKVSPVDILKDFVPQIGLGIRGFMFWQYRPEILGLESPGWGLVNLDGSDRSVTNAALKFWEALLPYKEQLMNSFAHEPEIGIWKSRKNEIFHFCMYGELNDLADGIENYSNILYWNNYRFKFINEHMLEHGELDNLKVLIMPSCYYLTELEAKELDKWVRAGGILLSEAHLAGYNATSGRHSRKIPGCGLAESWNIQELDSTSSYHLPLNKQENFKKEVSDDVKKALSTYKPIGGKYFPVSMKSAKIIWGAERFSSFSGADLTVEASFRDKVCLVSRTIGKGKIFYSGTNLGLGANKNSSGLLEFLTAVLEDAGITPSAIAENSGTVHVDILGDQESPDFICVINSSMNKQKIFFNDNITKKMTGLFSGIELDIGAKNSIEIYANFVDFFVTK